MKKISTYFLFFLSVILFLTACSSTTPSNHKKVSKPIITSESKSNIKSSPSPKLGTATYNVAKFHKAIALATAYGIQNHIRPALNRSYSVQQTQGDYYIVRITNHTGSQKIIDAVYAVDVSNGDIFDFQLHPEKLKLFVSNNIVFSEPDEQNIENAIALAVNYGIKHGVSIVPNQGYALDHMAGQYYVIHIYEDRGDHTATVAWYGVNLSSGEVVDTILHPDVVK